MKRIPQSQVEQAELKFLEKLRKHGEVTTDVIPDDLAIKYPDNGNWVGSIPRRLLDDELIVEVACVRSNRLRRHGGRIGLYAALNVAAIDGRIALLRSRLNLDESSGLDWSRA
ncbi:MAG: hypothetical protein JWP89_6457 [Schlesneria sp.]|nr:hypothetical protein [Schlesneria sp.]